MAHRVNSTFFSPSPRWGEGLGGEGLALTPLEAHPLTPPAKPGDPLPQRGEGENSRWSIITFDPEGFMSRLSLICVTLLSLGFASRLTAAEKPNVVLIVLDDYGWKDSGCYGSTYYKTPNIDKLAKSGVRFTEFYAACPVCSPTRGRFSRASIRSVGITDWLPGKPDGPGQKLNRPELPTGLPLEAVTLAESLKAAGYTTGHIGKWHLGGEKMSPTDQGFDVNIAGDDTGTPLSYFAPFKNKTRSMPGLENAPDGEYLTDRLAAEAEKFIVANKDKPFFLYLPHYAPHTPLKAKADVIAKYKQGNPGSQGNPVYAAMVESADDAVGRVLKALDDAKLADNTIVIFTSDNGGLATLEGQGTGLPATINAPFGKAKASSTKAASACRSSCVARAPANPRYFDHRCPPSTSPRRCSICAA